MSERTNRSSVGQEKRLSSTREGGTEGPVLIFLTVTDITDDGG